MEQYLGIRFEKRVLENDKDTEMYLFKGFRCSPDVAWLLSYMIGNMIHVEDVYLEVEDEDSVGIQRINIDEVGNFCDNYNEDDYDLEENND